MKQFDDLRSLSQLRDQLRPYWIDDLRSYANIGDDTTTGATLTDISAAIAAHRLEADPHPAYLTSIEADALFLTPSEASGLYYSKAALDGGALDTRYYTKSESESRYVNATGDTMTGQLTVNPGSAMAPFILGVNAQGQLVSGFNADQLDGYDSAVFPRKAENATISGSWTFGVNLSLASAAQIDFADVAEDKVYWYSNTYGTGVEASTLTHWSAVNHRWRIGGTSASTGTQKMFLNATGLQIGASSGTAAQMLDVTGNMVASGWISASAGVQAAHQLSYGTLGDVGHSSYFGIAATAFANSTSYALLQSISNGDTFLNTPTGRAIYYRVNNSDVMAMDVNRLNPASSSQKDLGDYNRKWRTLYASELYVETLVAQDVLATIGGRVMVTPTTTLIADVSTGSTTIDVKHNNLVSGDYVYMASAPAGAAQIEAMKVTSGATVISGGYRYSVSRNLDGSGANAWVVGDAVAELGGTVGQGYIDLTATNTLHNHLGPTMTVYSRTSAATWNGVKPVVSVGNLRSFVDYSSDTFGLAHGNDLTLTPASGFSGMTSDNSNGMRLFNLALNIYSGGTQTIWLNASNGLKFAANTSTPFTDQRAVSWYSGSDQILRVWSYDLGASSVARSHVQANAASTRSVELLLEALYTSGQSASTTITAGGASAKVFNDTATATTNLLVTANRTKFSVSNAVQSVAGFWVTGSWNAPTDYMAVLENTSTSTTAHVMKVKGAAVSSARILQVEDGNGDGFSFNTGGSFYARGSNAGFILYNRATDAASVQIYSQSAGTFYVYDQVAAANRLSMDASGNFTFNAVNVFVSANNVTAGQAAVSGNLSAITGRYGTSSSVSLSATDWGYASHLTFNAYLASRAVSYTASGAWKYLGAQYTGNVTAPGRISFDGNANIFYWAMGEAGLASGAGITTWNNYLSLSRTVLTTQVDLVVNGSASFTDFGATWANLSYATGWGSYGAPYGDMKYCKIGDVVKVSGLVKRVSGTTNKLGTLPSGYSPTTAVVFNQRATSGAVRVDVDTSGNIIWQSSSSTVGDWVSLAGISFRTSE